TSGPPGIGKTTLAEHYALLFAGAYPGGIFRVGPLGGGRRAGADEALSGYGDHLRAIARQLGIPIAGTPRGRLAAEVAEFLTRQGDRCLWIVDDVPVGRAPARLARRRAPARLVGPVVASRAGPAGWDARPVELAGLAAEEGRSLFVARGPGDEPDGGPGHPDGGGAGDGAGGRAAGRAERRAGAGLGGRLAGPPLGVRVGGGAGGGVPRGRSGAGLVRAPGPPTPAHLA